MALELRCAAEDVGLAKSFFDAYGALAGFELDPLVQAGRYRSQAAAEKQIIPDIVEKLRPEPQHDLLEIGCGSGNLAIPLSFLVKSVTGMDHPNVIAKASARLKADNLSWLPGRFPQNLPARRYDRILAYSVMHYLDSVEEIYEFVTAATGLLVSSGRLLLGDIPNADRKARFRNSEFGKQFEQQWQSRAKAGTDAADASAFEVFAGSSSIGTLDDASILGIVAHARKSGYHAYVMPQSPALPFGHTREDVLIIRL